MMKNESFIEHEKYYLSRLIDGDKNAFNFIFHRYYQPLCLYAYQFVTFEDVEEIVQDVLLWLWEHHDTLFFHTSLSAFLYKAVHLKCLTKIEQNSAKRRREYLYAEMISENRCTELADYPIENLLEMIQIAIGRLPDKYREAFVLHRFHDCTYQEIAEKLNVSPKTVDYRIGKALKILREEFKDYFPIGFFFGVECLYVSFIKGVCFFAYPHSFVYFYTRVYEQSTKVVFLVHISERSSSLQ